MINYTTTKILLIDKPLRGDRGTDYLIKLIINSKTKQMDKRCKLVMLPTAREPYEMPYAKTIPKSNLILGLQESLNYSKTLGFAKSPDEDRFPSLHSIGNYSKQMYQHLYITSDDKIKDGDWCILFDDFGSVMSTPQQYLKTKAHVLNSGLKKIIATTDSLYVQDYFWNGFDAGVKRLPQPTQSFIQKYVDEYNKGNIITKVLIEMVELDSQDYHAEIDYFGKTDIKLEYALKVNSSNEITIKKVKDSWTREEVVELCKSAYLDGYSEGGSNVSGYTMSDKCSWFEWLEENL